MKFKVGDKVIPSKPKDDTGWPVWYSDMDCSEGKELIIERVFGKREKLTKLEIGGIVKNGCPCMMKNLLRVTYEI